MRTPKALRLPARCTVLRREETARVEGGGILVGLFYSLARTFRSPAYDRWQAWDAQPFDSQEKGDFFAPTADRAPGPASLAGSVGDFFFGLGLFLAALGL